MSTMNNLCDRLFARRRLIYIASRSFFPFHLVKQFSAITRPDNAHLQSPFAEFANTKFNVSSSDISRIFKRAPHLQRLQTLEKVEEFVDMLSKHGLQQHQIASIMRVQPTLVTRNLEIVVQPKLLLLKDFGIEGEHLAKVLTTNPAILTLSVQSVLSNITFFKNIFESHDLFIKTVLRSSFILTSNVEKVVKPSLVFWEGCGVHGKELAQMVFANSRLLRISSLTPDKIDLIDKLGVKKESKMYKYILLLVAVSRMETLESKMHNLQMCGLSHEEVMGLFRASNFIFYLSKDNVRKKMDFIVNNMELSANFVVKHPSLLNMNFEKIVIPRFLVWKKMKSMDGIRHPKLKPLYTILTMAEANFVGKIVKEHPESTMLYSIYEKAKADASSLLKISTNSFLAIPNGGYKA